MTYCWHESYRAAVLETDWTKMPDRLRLAELDIQGRQFVLSLDDGGTPNEMRAIANALSGIRRLLIEVAEWHERQETGRGCTQTKFGSLEFHETD